MNELIRFMRGYCRAEVVSADTAKFMTTCARGGMRIWKIHRDDEITVKFCCYVSDEEKIKNICAASGASFTVHEFCSLAQLIKRTCRRKAFAASFVIFAAVVFLSSSFVRDVSVSGNDKISSDEILSELAKVGFRQGMLRYGINVKEIQNRLMINYDKLSWIWIDINGTNAQIYVKERIPVPEIENPDDFCNCVALHDGVVTEIMPRVGRQIAHVGDVVKKGDVLIGGVSETGTGVVRYVHADGIVKARTWYERSGVYGHTDTQRHLSGNVKKKRFLTVGGRTYPFFCNNESAFSAYDMQSETKNFSIFSKISLFSFTTETYCEIIEKEVFVNDDDVIKAAVESQCEDIYKEIGEMKDADISVIKKSYTHDKDENGNITVRTVFECTQSIAGHKPIEKPETTEEY